MSATTAKANDNGNNKDEKTDGGAAQEEKPILKQAPPPYHAVALVVLLVAVFGASLPSLESIDKVAKIETFTHRIFPDLLSLEALGYLRLSIALTIWYTSIYTIFVGPGWTQTTNYLPGSKLKNYPLRLVGLKTHCPFTCWCWTILGISYSFNAALTLKAAWGLEDWIQPWMLRCAVVVWEIAAPFTVLVAAVIRYAIWDIVLKGSGDTSELRSVRNIMMHNVNVVFAFTEIGLLGGLPVQFLDFAVAPLFGMIYVCFAWNTTHLYAPAEAGPQFLYFFMDTTLGSKTSIALLILLAVLMVSFGIFAGIQHLLEFIGGGFAVHALAVLLLSGCVCRLRD